MAGILFFYEVGDCIEFSNNQIFYSMMMMILFNVCSMDSIYRLVIFYPIRGYKALRSNATLDFEDYTKTKSKSNYNIIGITESLQLRS